MIQRNLTRIFAILLLCCSHSSLSAQQTNSIKISTLGFPPYAINDKQSPRGIYYDTANLLAKEAGYQSQNTITPYIRIKSELKSGKSDMTIMFKYKDLEEYVTYIAPLPTLQIVVIALNGSSFSRLSQLKGKKIAYLRGASFSHEIDSDPEVIKYRTTDFLQGVRMLTAGRVDAIIGPMEPILSAARKINRDEELFGTPLIVAERTPWVQISNKSLGRISAEKLKAIYRDMDKRGVIENIRHKYLNIRSTDKSSVQ